MATLQVEVHYTSSGNQEGCSFPELVHREPRELRLLWFIENMTAHVDQLPSSQNKNKLRTDEMKWLAHHHVWAKRKARLRTSSHPGLISVAMTCLTSKILHLLLTLMLSCSYCKYPQTISATSAQNIWRFYELLFVILLAWLLVPQLYFLSMKGLECHRLAFVPLCNLGGFSTSFQGRICNRKWPEKKKQQSFVTTLTRCKCLQYEGSSWLYTKV